MFTVVSRSNMALRLTLKVKYGQLERLGTNTRVELRLKYVHSTVKYGQLGWSSDFEPTSPYFYLVDPSGTTVNYDQMNYGQLRVWQ